MKLFSKYGVSSSRLTAFLVVTAFVAPILIAWWMVRTPSLLADIGLLNKGTLISPPIDIASSEGYHPLRELEMSPGEWTIFFFSDSICDGSCLKALNVLRTIRSLLGHSGTRVNVKGLFPSENSDELDHLNDSGTLKHLSSEVAARIGIPTVTSGFFFLDWRGQIVSYFSEDANPADIKKDIKRLLRGSKLD
jgi:hypothetical protein